MPTINGGGLHIENSISDRRSNLSVICFHFHCLMTPYLFLLLRRSDLLDLHKIPKATWILARGPIKCREDWVAVLCDFCYDVRFGVPVNFSGSLT